MDIRSDRQKGLSYVELGKKYHIDPRTAKRYAESPQKPEYTLSEPKPTKMDPYKQIVDEWLEEAPYSALRILEKLREMGFNGGYSIVKAYVSSRKMDLNEKATVRFETMPGKQGQMDWGVFEDHLVYEDGKWKKLYCFLMILGYSRMRYIEFVTDMSTNTLIRCHQNAFRYFGGYPEEILYDNMKQVVIKRLLKQEDSTLNRQFEDFAGFYCALPGFVDSKNEEKTERNAGYLVVSHSGGGMLRQGTRKGIRRTPANRGMRAHWVVKGLDISEDVCHGMCP